MSDAQQEFERDALITSRSMTLADIADELLGEDAGTALLKAMLISWERAYGKAGAVELARTALLGLHEPSDPNSDLQKN